MQVRKASWQSAQSRKASFHSTHQAEHQQELIDKLGDPNFKRLKPLRDTWLRWLMFSFATIVVGGYSYCYDIPAPLKNPIIEKCNLSNTESSLLYTSVSYTNVIMPIIGGIFLDKIGIRIGVIVFIFFVFSGQLIFMLAGYRADDDCTADDFKLMFIGRIVFSLGGECLEIAQSTIISKWFKGRDLAFAIGLTIGLQRLFTGLCGTFSMYAYEQSQSLGFAIMIGTCFCAGGFFFAIFLCILDYAAEKRDMQIDEEEIEQIQCKDLTEFPRILWILIINCVLLYCAIMPFTQVISGMAEYAYFIPANVAGTLFAIPFYMSALGTAFVGKHVDLNGKRPQIAITSSIILFLAHMSIITGIGAEEGSPMNYFVLIPIFMVGWGYTLYNGSFWSSIPLVVKPHVMATAFGVTTAIQNMGLALFPTIGGYINDLTKGDMSGYRYEAVWWAFLSLLGYLSVVWLMIEDQRTGKRLTKTSQETEIVAFVEDMDEKEGGFQKV